MFNKKIVRKFTKKQNKKKSKKYKIKKFYRRKKKKIILFWISKKKSACVNSVFFKKRQLKWDRYNINYSCKCNLIFKKTKKGKKEKKRKIRISTFLHILLSKSMHREYCGACLDEFCNWSIRRWIVRGLYARKSIIKEFLWFTITCKPSFSLARIRNQWIHHTKNSIPIIYEIPINIHRFVFASRLTVKKGKARTFHYLTYEGKREKIKRDTGW